MTEYYCEKCNVVFEENSMPWECPNCKAEIENIYLKEKFEKRQSL